MAGSNMAKLFQSCHRMIPTRVARKETRMTDKDATDDWYGEDAATFGDRLAAARETAGVTQTQLATRLGVKVTTVGAWEDDLKEPRANRLQMLSGMLNISLSWLLTGIGDGVEGPLDDVAAQSPDLQMILTDMRVLRIQMIQSAERLALLEKRLLKASKVV